MSPLLDRFRTLELTLDELVGAARDVLSRVDADSSDERVATYPDARTVRYYQTLGLLDRPTRYDGRRAIYRFRHLLQVVAVKLLQSAGLSLAQAQRSLHGATEERLEAAVREALGAPPPPAEPPGPAERVRALVAAEIAPGVHVTLDPALVPDPEETLARLAAALDASAAPPKNRTEKP